MKSWEKTIDILLVRGPQLHNIKPRNERRERENSRRQKRRTVEDRKGVRSLGQKKASTLLLKPASREGESRGILFSMVFERAHAVPRGSAARRHINKYRCDTKAPRATRIGTYGTGRVP